MRRLLFKFIFAILPFIAFAGTYSHSESFDFVDFTFNKIEICKSVYSLPSLSGLDCLGEVGEPMLPAKRVIVALPYDASDISVEGVELSFCSQIPTELTVAPIPQETPYDIIWKEPTYPEDSKFPKEQVKIVHVENYKGLYKLVYICVFPITYYPKINNLTLIEKVSFSLEYKCNNNPLNNEMLTPNYVSSPYYKEDLNTIRKMVVNPDMVIEYDSDYLPQREHTSNISTLPAYEYTIITTDELAPNFQRLIALKRIHGLKAGIVCVNDIINCPEFSEGDTISKINDDAGKIKAYLYANRDSIRYVLFGGRAPIIPIRYGKEIVDNIYETYIPTDLYFGTGPDTNWNHNLNGIYGEKYTGFSYSSIFNIGRLLCKNSEEINNYLDKLEIYELNPGFGDYSYLQNAYTHSSNGLYNSFVNTVSNQLSNIFSNHVLSVSSTSNIHTGTHVISEINNNKVFFLDIHGHGNPGNITTTDINISYGIDAIAGETIYTQIENGNNGFDKIRNFGFPGICYNCGCTTTPFDSPRLQGYGLYNPDYDTLTMNIGESYTTGKNYGGIAYLGNTRYGYIGTSQSLESCFLNYLINTTNRYTLSIGDAENYSKISKFPLGYTNSLGSVNHYIALSHNIIGDPSVEIWRTNDGVLNLLEASVAPVNDGLSISLANPLRAGEFAIATVIEPNGSFRKQTVTEQNFSIPNATANSVVYVYSPNHIPYIGNVKIPKNVNINISNYIYADSVFLGSNTTAPRDAVNFYNGINYTFDTKSDVYIDRNVCVSGNSVLKIYTPGTCNFLNGITVTSDSKVIVYCNETSGIRNIISEIMDGRIEILAYDKYGVANQSFNPKPALSEESQQYYPMLEEGKEWTYRLIRYTQHPSQTPQYPSERELVYKIDGTVVQDEETFYRMSFYLDDVLFEAEETVVLLKEIPEEKKIEIYGPLEIPYLYHPWYYDEIKWEKLLYDFTDPMNSESLDEWDITYEEPFEMELLDGIHNSHLLKSKNSGLCALVEGVGIIALEESTLSTYDIFGECARVGMEWMIPRLYKVTGGDGHLIYLNPKFEKGCTSTRDLNVGPSVKMLGETIEVSGADANVASLYNMQGQCVATQTLVNGSGSISTKHVPTGIYLISVGTLTQKIFIK